MVAVANERLLVVLWLASAAVLGSAYFLPVEYEPGLDPSAPASVYGASETAMRVGHVKWHGRSFAMNPTWSNILVFSLPIGLALVQVAFRGKGAGTLAMISPIVLAILLVVLAAKVLFFDFDLFDTGSRNAFGGAVALAAMGACLLLSVFVAAAKNRSAQAPPGRPDDRA